MSTHNRRISRLFLDRDLSDDFVSLTEREANYLGNVLRLKRGDALLAFDGRGNERRATIASLARRHGELSLLEAVAPVPESALDLTLIQALPKAEAMDLTVQKATELGVRALWPVKTDFSVVRLDGDRAERRAEHWRRVAQSACEQCGRHRPPEILPVRTLDAALAALPATATRLAFDVDADGALESQPRAAGAVFAVCGPEGGFSPADSTALRDAGFERIRLGPRILRAETAALVACALLQSRWGDLR